MFLVLSKILNELPIEFFSSVFILELLSQYYPGQTIKVVLVLSFQNNFVVWFT